MIVRGNTPWFVSWGILGLVSAAVVWLSRSAWSAPAETTRSRALASLPYLQGYKPPPPETGVISPRPDQAYPGYNFFVSGHDSAAYLMDMAGGIRHRWSKRYGEVWPEKPPPEEPSRWRRALLFPNGELLAIFDDTGGLAKLDRDSNVIWRYGGRHCHHHLVVAEEGDIYVLTNERISRPPGLGGTGPVLDDQVTFLDSAGREKGSISILECFLSSPYASLLEKPRDEFDIFHTNTLVVLDGRLEEKIPAFKRGNILLSIRNLDALVVLDPCSREIVWAAVGPWKAQHQPEMLPGGNILLFDNQGGGEGYSRVLEFDPVSRQVVWEFKGTSANDFFSRTLGTVQPLPNGNILVVESESGKAFELTPDKEEVWSFYNPHRISDSGEKIAALYDLVRVDAGKLKFSDDVSPGHLPAPREGYPAGPQ